MNAGQLSREDTDVYKGVGILLIALHNYFHWVEPNPGENEFNFDRARTISLLNGLQTQPLEAVNLLLSYFGHYGVQLFVFLSAYGLARTYFGREIRWAPFMWHRVDRIYPTFLLAVAAHLLFVVTLWNEHLLWFLKVYLLELSMLSAFVPNMQLTLVGPWWFFSFIFQFYAVFPLLNRLAAQNGPGSLVAVGVGGLAITVIANPYLTSHGLNVYVTVLGHLPVLCLGIYMARADKLSVDHRLVLAAAVTFVLGNWFEPLWYLAPISATLLLIASVPRLIERLRTWPLAWRCVRYCGVVSLPLFAIHGMLRQPFTAAANDRNVWYFTLALAVVFLVVSLATAQSMRWIDSLGRKWAAPAGTHES